MRNSAIESIDCSIATGAVVAQIIENAPKSLKKKKKKENGEDSTTAQLHRTYCITNQLRMYYVYTVQRLNIARVLGTLDPSVT